MATEDAADDDEVLKEKTCTQKCAACPGWFANFLYHSNEDGNFFCSLTCGHWCQIWGFLFFLWAISGAFWYMCFVFTATWPMDALWAYFVCFGLFVLLFVALMAMHTEESDLSKACSASQLKDHIAKQMHPDMKWEDFGTKWHIQHQTDLKSENLNDTADQRLDSLCLLLHWTNTEPVWDENDSHTAKPAAQEEKKDDVVTMHHDDVQKVDL